jgi:uncharacterized membrane protein
MALHPLVSRLVYSKIVLVLFVISLIWTLSLFLVPASLPPGKVSDLSGYANRIDYGELWDELPPPHAAVYYIGDLECHQISERSFYVAANQMPVCARDTGIFVFVTIGLLMAMVVQPSPSTSRMLINLLPRKVRPYLSGRKRELPFLLLMIFLFLIPIALDGGLQFVSDYESTNPMRFLTGSMAGWIGGFLLGAMIISTKMVTSGVQEPVAANG